MFRAGLLSACLFVLAFWTGLCPGRGSQDVAAEGSSRKVGGGGAQQEDDKYLERRAAMVDQQLRGRDITDREVLEAMAAVPRHLFVPEEIRDNAYYDRPLPIGRGQTISQPYIVALMTQLADIGPDGKVLEIGTGSGYQAAVLAEITDKVYSIEIDCVLAERARSALDGAGYTKVVTKCGDGYFGWPEHAPFDAVLVTAAAPKLPTPLLEQLKVGGRLVIPVGRQDDVQVMKLITRTTAGYEERSIEYVAFVPMTGEVEK